VRFVKKLRVEQFKKYGVMYVHIFAAMLLDQRRNFCAFLAHAANLRPAIFHERKIATN
jgi:hypothetical protein